MKKNEFPLTKFSRERLPENLSPNRWTRILNEIREHSRATGTPIFDLSISNPTAAGFSQTREFLRRALSSGTIEKYFPTPRGNEISRRAIADFYKKIHGANVVPEQIFLTASSSESYSWLAKILGNAGDNFLVPAPSYPLIPQICRLENVFAKEYFLKFSKREMRWKLDFSSLEKKIDARTKAFFCVSPNNPTGSVLSFEERSKLVALAREQQIPLVVDEVFLEFGNEKNPFFSDLKSFAGTPNAPIFVLGGLSKSAALPQIKIGWIVVSGTTNFVEAASTKLEFVADTFLSAGTPNQISVPEILKNSETLRKKIRERLAQNENLLSAWTKISPHKIAILPRTAGWYSILELPRGVDEERLSEDLLRRENVIAHPGFFYDVHAKPLPHVVLSLLTTPEILSAELPKIDSALLRN